GPYQALNPHSLWLMAIAIAGVSFVGYLAVKLAGQRYGILIAGLAGGLVSSTVSTLDMARRAATGGEHRYELAGALAASGAVFGRVGVIVALFGPSLLPGVAPPILAGMLVLAVVALWLARPWQRSGAGDPSGAGSSFANPLEIRSVLGFAALLAV